MNYLKEKSDFNIEGAEMLIENDLYAPSIHCSYYSVFQLMKDKFLIKTDTTCEQYSALSNNKSSHKFLLNEFSNLIVDSYEKNKFYRKFKDLKTVRIKSDYYEKQINYDLSIKSLKTAKELLLEVKKV